MQLIYEVTVILPQGAFDSAVEWMQAKHIPEVLTHQAFTGAKFFTEVTNGVSCSFTTQYEAISESALQNYIDTFAVEMRADFNKVVGPHNPEVRRRILKRYEI